MPLDPNSDLIQSLAIGATGGIPTSVLLMMIVRNLGKTLDEVKRRFDAFEPRFQRMELIMEVQFQNEIKRLSEALTKQEAKLRELETAVNRLSV